MIVELEEAVEEAIKQIAQDVAYYEGLVVHCARTEQYGEAMQHQATVKGLARAITHLENKLANNFEL